MRKAFGGRYDVLLGGYRRMPMYIMMGGSVHISKS
jgi:hypothetical protein